MKILFFILSLIVLSGCGDDLYEEDYKANLKLVRDCIESGGDPQFASNTLGDVTTFYGCRP